MPFIEAEKAPSGDAGKPKGKIVIATVKGDVHDIGKNIVGVVLQCNNYEVDQPRRDGAVRRRSSRPRASENADIIGSRASSRRRSRRWRTSRTRWSARAIELPLLIGGATTSRTHTAVKIAPNYTAPTVWVPDASRSVSVLQQPPVATSLRAGYIADVRADYEKMRAQHAGKKGPKLDHARGARARTRSRPTGSAYAPPKPRACSARGAARTTISPRSRSYIDWGPFFQTWELSGPYPDDPRRPGRRRSRAQRASPKARRCSKRIIEGRWLTASGVFGLLPARNACGDDIEIYADERGSAC